MNKTDPTTIATDWQPFGVLCCCAMGVVKCLIPCNNALRVVSCSCTRQYELRNSFKLLRLFRLLSRRENMIWNKVLVYKSQCSHFLLQRIMQSVIPPWALSRTQNRSSFAFFSQPHCPLQSLSKNVYLFLCFYYSQKKDNNKMNKNVLRCFCCRFLFSMLKWRVCVQRVCACVWLSLCGYACVCSLSACFLKLVYIYVSVCVCGSCCHVHVCIATVCFSLFFSLMQLVKYLYDPLYTLFCLQKV